LFHFLLFMHQTRRHLDLTAFDGGSGHGMVFVDGLGDLVDYEGVGQISLNQPLVRESMSGRELWVCRETREFVG
jgi:hypothetical protein